MSIWKKLFGGERSPKTAIAQARSDLLPALAASCHDAAMGGDLVKVQALLKDNPDLVFSKDNKGMSPLHWAAQAGHKDVAELLLAKGADVNAMDNEGRMPLHLAGRQGRRDVTELLLANGADVNAKNNDGRTPLHLAASMGRQDIVILLLANKADVNAKTTDGQTPLHLAASMGRQDIVNLLLADKADVNAKTTDGQTPLHQAAREGHWGVTHLLLANGADVNAKGNDGWTALMWASDNGHIDVVQALLANGADVNAKIGANIKRWKLSGEPQAWVSKHPQGWNHNEWLELLLSLRKSQFWPMDEAAIGQHLEMLRDELKKSSMSASDGPQKEKSRDELLREIRDRFLAPDEEGGHIAILHPSREQAISPELAQDIQRAKLKAIQSQLLDVDDFIGAAALGDPFRRVTEKEKAELLRQADINYEKKREKHLRRALEPVAEKWNRSIEDLMRLV